MSSIVSKVPESSRSDSRMLIVSPRPAARESQSVRMVAKCSPWFHCARRPIILADSALKTTSGDSLIRPAARLVAGKSVSAGWLVQLIPIPITTVVASSPSARMPANLAPFSRRSLGHLIASRGRAAGARSAIASWIARAATNESSDQCSGGAGSVSSRLANRLPGSEVQVRPRRPRPALCRPAVTHSGPRSPARASVSASVLVDAKTSCDTSRTPAADALGSSCIISKERLRSRCRRLYQRAWIEHEQQIEQTAHAEYRLQLGRHRAKSLGRLVKIHDLDDGQVVVGTHDAGEHAEHRESEQARLDRRHKHVPFREEAREPRNPREREQERGEEEGQRRIGVGQAREITDLLYQRAVATHRQDAGEGAERHGDIDRHVDEHALHAFGRAGRQADEREAHMTDRG